MKLKELTSVMTSNELVEVNEELYQVKAIPTEYLDATVCFVTGHCVVEKEFILSIEVN